MEAVPMSPALRSATLRAALGILVVPGSVLGQLPFSASVAPNPVSLQVGGGSAVVTVSTTATGAFREPILYSFTGFPAGIDTGGTRTVSPPYEPQNFAFSAGPSVASGTYSGMLTGMTSAGSLTVPMTVVVQAAPVITAILPGALTAGARENLLRISGRNFQPGAELTSEHAGLQVLQVRVLSATVAEAVVAARPDLPPGPYRFQIRNPDGSGSGPGPALVVHPMGSLAGPVSVTGVHVVSPRPWQVVAEGERVYPRALLATTGMGTVVGTWLLDGVPFHRFTQVVSGGGPVDVRSPVPIPTSFTGEHRLELVLESPRTLPPQGVSFLQAPDRPAPLRFLVPGEDGRVDREAPHLRWSLVPGASGYRVELRHRPRGGGNGASWSIIQRRVRAPEWHPEEGLRRLLSTEETQVRVVAVFPGEVTGDVTDWQILTVTGLAPAGEAGPQNRSRGDVDQVGANGLEGALDEGTPSRLARDSSPSLPGRPLQRQVPTDPSEQFDLTLGLTTTASSSQVPGPSGLSRLQLSSQVDLRSGRLHRQLSGDISASHDLGDPWSSRAEGGNWVARLALLEGPIRPEATVGFAPPAFVEGSELLGLFSPGGGVQGLVASPVGQVFFYGSARLRSRLNPAQPEPRVRAAGYEAATDDGRFLLRGTTLRVTERPDGLFSSGGETDALGVLARAQLHPALELMGEAASGEFTPGPGGFDEAREGSAFRMGARGAAGTLGYSASFSRSDAGFVNPTNPGFTSGGVSDRTRAELSLTNTFFGRASLQGTFHHARSGSDDSPVDPTVTEHGGTVSLSLPASSWVFISLSGNLAEQSGDPLQGMDTPVADRTQKGFSISLMETLGAINLSQSMSRQLVSDRAHPWAGQQMTDVQLGAHGSVHPLLDISTTLSGSQVKGAAEVGTSRFFLASVQPALALGTTGLRLAPRAAFTRSEGDLAGTFHSTQYHLAARWSAPWEVLRLDVELSTDLARSWDADDEVPPFQRQTRFTVGLNWQTGRPW
jgi:hypothetical protein